MKIFFIIKSHFYKKLLYILYYIFVHNIILLYIVTFYYNIFFMIKNIFKKYNSILNSKDIIRIHVYIRHEYIYLKSDNVYKL